MSKLPPKSHYPPEHVNHLCFVVAHRGLLTKIDLDKVRQLVAPAKFVCADCGRVAAKAENLCNPVEL